MKKIRALLCMVCIASLMLLPAAAAENYVEIDPGRTDCSIELTMKYKDPKGKEQPMKGGTLSIYTVASVLLDDADQSFDITGGKFADQSIVADIPSMTSEDLAANNSKIASALAKVASSVSPDKTASIGSGKASFKGLKPGLYLVVQTKKSDKKATINPFLISIPDAEGNFNLTAQPKAGATAPPPETPPELPKTGQLWWPVALLAGAGILVLLIGLYRRKIGKMK